MENKDKVKNFGFRGLDRELTLQPDNVSISLLRTRY